MYKLIRPLPKCACVVGLDFFRRRLTISVSENVLRLSRPELKARHRFLHRRVEISFESIQPPSSSTSRSGKTEVVQSRVSSSSIGFESRPRPSLIWKTIHRPGSWSTTMSNRSFRTRKNSGPRQLQFRVPAPTSSPFST